MYHTPKNQMSMGESNKLFSYEDGFLTWKVGNAKTKGKIAGYNNNGYYVLKRKGKLYKQHNIIWNMHYGKIEDGCCIDHIDINGLNNKIENLRLSNPSKQMFNQKISKRNTSGVRGVSYKKKDDMWFAKIMIKGNDIHLGAFTDKQDAVKARKKAEVELL